MSGRIDVAVVGAGPAGIASAIYLQRAGIGNILFERDKPGGLLNNASMISNYPGFPGGIEASSLIQAFMDHLGSVGGSISRTGVQEIYRNDDELTVRTVAGLCKVRAVIIATGTIPKQVNIEGSETIPCEQISYSLSDVLKNADPNARVMVYGGGDIAFDQACNLSARHMKVTIICRSKARCLKSLYEDAIRSPVQID